MFIFFTVQSHISDFFTLGKNKNSKNKTRLLKLASQRWLSTVMFIVAWSEGVISVICSDSNLEWHCGDNPISNQLSTFAEIEAFKFNKSLADFRRFGLSDW